ncbi:PREDICTED: uncharacterized protein LOC108772967 [Cyphomyrmex costatus]|uniref:uncharacterized protein LOC108772967 n=1 Tax=Cyphomyrmex costatus TaxID=456900 RepID=UPI0008522545|nr:PREDICTED: uncharacterized protein LOC108772967 [Cyphomyrmex costatus]
MEQLLSAQLQIHGRIARTMENLKKAGAANIGVTMQRAQLLNLERTLSVAASDTEVKPANSDMISLRNTLPRIPLPQFSGKFEDWPAYRDLFESLVITEPSLSNIKRFQYLKSSVKGDAEQLIISFPTTSENFDRAWTTLTDHYENKRLLLRSYLSAFTSLGRMKHDSVADIRRIFNRMITTVGALEGIGRPLTNCTDLFVHLIVELLDDRTKQEWEKLFTKKSDPPSYEQLRDFLENQVLKQGVLRPKASQGSSGKSSEKITRSLRTQQQPKRGAESNRNCPICNQEHYIMICEHYKSRTPQERKEIVNTHRLCMNCLERHKLTECPSTKHCGKCTARHHTTLHEAFVDATTISAVAIHVTDRPTIECTPVLLATARVLVTDSSGALQTVRALVDPGSETCLVAESLAQRLRLPRTPTAVAIYGVGGQQTGVLRARVSLSLTSRVTAVSMKISALVFPRITDYGGVADRRSCAWAHLQGLELADPEFYNQDPVELLLGADVYAYIALSGIRKGGSFEPIAQNTQIGWVLLGAAGVSNACSIGLVTSLCCSPADELNSLVRRFWEQEELPQASAPWSLEDPECKEHFQQTHTRDSTGRYQVRLPVRSSLVDLSATRRMAVRMLAVMERRFVREPTFRDRYCNFMREYLSLGHMSFAVPLSSDEVRVCFLPHHGVLKGTGSEEKIRVVFNGSAKILEGSSLNDSLLPGPNLLPALSDVISRWRCHRFVVSTDIEKMYRQIRVHPEDRNLQRILWTENGQPLEFRLNTVTYGLACTPYLAIRVLRQLADDDGKEFPLAAEALRRDTYVDDILSGAASLTEARTLTDQLSIIAGSLPTILLPPEGQLVLGLRWESKSDCFAFTVHTSIEESLTKRLLLSNASRLFDPLGWLAPVTVRAKLIIQSAWLQQLGWDEPLRDEEAAAWTSLRDQLPLLEDLRVPRWMHVDSPGVKVEIHGFSDASERAYGAAIYLRTLSGEDITTSLVMAKTKVAPLKRVSLPRLELCAASILAKLAAHVASTLGLVDAETHLWTDSTVVLAWIRGHPAKWTTYVANRVAEIQRTMSKVTWHHVPGRDNPADCASRGLSPREMLSHSLWWRGPNFLCNEKSEWPLEPGSSSLKNLPEQRTGPCLVATGLKEPEELTRFSSWQRLIRVTAWILR